MGEEAPGNQLPVPEAQPVSEAERDAARHELASRSMTIIGEVMTSDEAYGPYTGSTYRGLNFVGARGLVGHYMDMPGGKAYEVKLTRRHKHLAPGTGFEELAEAGYTDTRGITEYIFDSRQLHHVAAMGSEELTDEAVDAIRFSAISVAAMFEVSEKAEGLMTEEEKEHYL